MWKDILYYDAYLGHLINQMGSSKQDFFWIIITNTYSWIPFFILLIYLIFSHFTQKKAIYIIIYTLLVLMSTVLITNMTKVTIQRVRPIYHEVFSEYFRFITDAKGYSFFSGHTSNSLAISLFLFLILRYKTNFTFFIFIWPILFAYSRLYLGVHYPLDILFGAIIGIIVASIYYYIFSKFHPNFIRE